MSESVWPTDSAVDCSDRAGVRATPGGNALLVFVADKDHRRTQGLLANRPAIIRLRQLGRCESRQRLADRLGQKSVHEFAGVGGTPAQQLLEAVCRVVKRCT